MKYTTIKNSLEVLFYCIIHIYIVPRLSAFLQPPVNKLKIFEAPLDDYKYFIDICTLLKKLRKYT